MTPLQQVIDKTRKLAELYWLDGRIDRQHFEALAQEAFAAGQASQRERDAPYMQHKPGCRALLKHGPPCACGLDAIRSSSLTTNEKEK